MEPVIPATLKLHNAEKKAAWLQCLVAASALIECGDDIRDMPELADALYNEYLLRCPPPA
jgi:hypothetical protein